VNGTVKAPKFDWGRMDLQEVLRDLPDSRLCGIARNIGRAGESWRTLTLGELREAEVDMFCTVIVGNVSTKEIAGRLITPRGYKNV